ncbi:hypothetical protein [Actinomadura atramentaria]|uniref:hypothetical protein n=1 Tax=Actinomadura atramentaria TaxID=1990 RepID=UPI000374E5D8|nr:hypothetical protein [Actinomadura atramentaria]
MSKTRRWNHHRNRDEAWCGWSEEDVDEELAGLIGADRCPDGCEESEIEEVEAA